MLIAPGADKEVTTTITLDTSHMGEWFASHILSGEKSKFNVQASLVFELPSQAADWLGQKRLVVPVWQGEQTFETNILGIQ
jgi:LEA14-like dessication related protein